MELKNIDTVLITQARCGSTRLPNKILKEIEGKTLLEIQVERIKKSNTIDDFYIATTTNEEDGLVESLAQKLGVKCFRGSENDVLDRFYQTIVNIQPKYVIRVTSDCPLIDPALIDEIVTEAKKSGLDYYANILEERYPDGQDIEVFTFQALERAWKQAKLASEREHVTPFIRVNSSFLNGKLFKSGSHRCAQDYSQVRLTVDEMTDFKVIERLIRELGFDATWKEYADYYLMHDEIHSMNSSITRNEGYIKSISKDFD